MRAKKLTIEDIRKALKEIETVLPTESIIIGFEVSITTTKKPKGKIAYDNQTIISTSSVRRKEKPDLTKTHS